MESRSQAFILYSPDAIDWQLTYDEPVISQGTFDSQNIAFWDDRSGIYREYYRMFHRLLEPIVPETDFRLYVLELNALAAVL